MLFCFCFHFGGSHSESSSFFFFENKSSNLGKVMVKVLKNPGILKFEKGMNPVVEEPFCIQLMSGISLHPGVYCSVSVG